MARLPAGKRQAWVLAAARQGSSRHKPLSHVGPIAFVPRGKAAVSRRYLRTIEEYQGCAQGSSLWHQHADPTTC